MNFYYIEEPAQDEFDWGSERKRGIKKKISDLKGSFNEINLRSILELPKNTVVIVNSYSCDWTKICIDALLVANMKPIQMIEAEGTSFVSYDYRKEFGACLDILESLANNKPVVFVGKDTKSIRDQLKIIIYQEKYQDKAILFDSPYSNIPSGLEESGAILATNDVVGLSVLEYLENKQINIPIGCPISTSIGMLNRKRFIYFMIDNFLLGQQAVTLATYLMKNSHINNIGMYIGSPASLQTYRKNNDYFENETDYRQNDDVSKLVIVNKFLAKSDDVDLQIIKLLDKNKSINYISKELFLGETTVKYRLLKLFGTQKLKYCRDVSRIIVEWITMHKK